ncbi:jg254, partial [Pararge aegeria aegeria]
MCLQLHPQPNPSDETSKAAKPPAEINMAAYFTA